MPKIFSVASWNVENFKNPAPGGGRIRRITEFISGQHDGPPAVPDVFALYEVVGKEIYQDFMTAFPDHRFHLTEGVQNQEIFIGVHRRLQTFSTQRLEFKAGRAYQRPGLLLTIRKDGVDYPLLFLHVRSGDGPEDFGLRDAALTHAFNLKKTLDKNAGAPANFIFLGDLNTMGIDDPVPWYTKMDLPAEEEVERIAYWASKRKMTLLAKDKTIIGGNDKEVTWYNGSSSYVPTNLDHVVASNHMTIQGQGGSPLVTVLGWPKLAEPDWDAWLSDYSDHAMLYFEVWP